MGSSGCCVYNGTLLGRTQLIGSRTRCPSLFQGQLWQFKPFTRWHSNPVEIFAKIPAFHVHYDDLNVGFPRFERFPESEPKTTHNTLINLLFVVLGFLELFYKQ